MLETTSLRKSRRKLGLTLLELLAVVTIIGILAAVLIPRIGGHTAEAKKHVCHQYKSDLNSAVDRYLFDKGQLPADVQDLESAGFYPEAIPKCPVDNQDYELDPVTGRIVGHDHP